MKVEIKANTDNYIGWESLTPGDVIEKYGNHYLVIRLAGKIAFADLDSFVVLSMDALTQSGVLPVLKYAKLVISHLTEDNKHQEPDDAWEYLDVNSGWIEQIGYNAQTHGFWISMRDGNDYNYSDVAPWIWDEIKLARSTGSYYNNHIKGKYKQS